jgi:hypothetical protein
MWVDNDVPNWFSNIEKFLPVAIFKMATTIPHKFNIVRFQREIEQCWILVVLWWPFWKWRPVEICQCWNTDSWTNDTIWE